MKNIPVNHFTPLIIAFSVVIQFGYFIFRIDRPVSSYFIVGFLFLMLCFSKKIGISYPYQLRYMMMWLIYCVVTALVTAPIMLGYTPRLQRVAYESVYVVFALFYMIIGYNIAKFDQEKSFWKITAYLALGVSALAILSEMFNIEAFKKWFYLSGVGIRFQGVAENPNDYIPLALVVLSYFLYSNSEKKCIKWVSVSILIFSFLAAGSKGGIVTLGLYAAISMIEYIFIGKKKYVMQLCLLSIPIIVAIVLFAILNLDYLVKFSEEVGIPGLERIFFMLSNPIKALSAGGSLRMETWNGAILQIKASPLLGVGIGSSRTILEMLGYEYSHLTPHNIYLELMAQSGAIWFLYISISFFRLLKKTCSRSLRNDPHIKVIRHGFYFLLINGLYFASDWCLIFWLLLGFLFHHVNCEKLSKQYIPEEKQ